MSTSLRKPVGVGIIAGALTALAVFGGTGAFLAAAQDTPDTTTPDTTDSPDTTQAPDTTVPSEDDAPSAEERQARREEWRQCMADNGVDLPEPQLDENGRPVRPTERPRLDDAQREAFKAAAEACGLPGPRFHGGPGGGAGCFRDDEAPETAPEESTPDAEGSSFSFAA